MATYAEIIAYAPLATYLSNRETTTEMPNIVRRAQEYITQRLDHDFFRASLSNTTAAASTGIVDQSGWTETIMEVRSLSVEVRAGRFVPVRKRDINMLEALYIDAPVGTPMHYAEDADGQIIIFPAPSVAKAVKVTANVKEPTLSSTVGSNKISLEYPHLFEVAVAREVAIFNIDPTAAEIYTTQLQDLLTSANTQISRERRDEVSQRPTETRNVTGS